jgi:pyrroline-5-carboxylate reductase
MPNTPCLVGRGVSTLIQSNLNESDIVMATYIFNSVGKTIWIQEEEWMHTVTAVSNTSPAYFFHMMHILKDAACKAGIPEDIAETLSIQTAIGSSQLALNSADDLITLKKKVMSPGGTTEAAFDSLEKNKLDDIWDKAINAARQRSVDLGKN